MTENEREIQRVIKYIRSCREAGIDTTITLDISKSHFILNALEEIQQYRAIGTVEECKALKEKNEPKKPTDTRYFGEAGYYIGLCPTCKSGNNSEFQYCGDCGQKLDWE